jgi:NTP pyrophosphatase (non-canonical NTP hydrolase)
MMKRDPKHQKRFEKLASLLLLTVEEADELCRAASSTWEYIAYDCLAADPGRDMKADEVIEVVLDANHITSNTRNLSPKVRTLLDSYTMSPTIQKLLKEFVFVYKSYGM